MSFDVTGVHRGSSFTDHDVISAGPFVSGSLLSLAFSGAEPTGIDALLVRSNLVIFSTDIDFRLLGADYADEDLIAYNFVTGVYTMYFDGSAFGVPRRADLDAACFESGTTNLWLSFDVTMTLPGAGVVTDDDVVRFASGVFSKKYEGRTALGIPEAADLDALHADSGYLYYSLDISARISSIDGTDRDVWRVATNTLATSLLTGFGLEARTDLTAMDDLTDSDSDGLNDLEEITGLDEAGTTYPGTGALLAPGGFKSNPLLADTDGDGIIDGHEAAAGTNPTNATDYLRITSINLSTNAHIVTWASVIGRIYDLESASLVTGFDGIAADNVPGMPGATSVTNAGPVDARFYRISVQP